MRYSRALIPTLREVPAEAEVISHQLMLRTGCIRQVARGVYTYLPMGWRVLQNIMHIVRTELNAVGCEEVQMPCVVPAELWHQSGRWPVYGKELLRLKDRHDREYCFGPTHEEVITSTVAATVKSYRELPKNLYQIHTKFRDEIRPRFGLMRGREFLMKDGYSFHATMDDLQREYAVMQATYQRIFTRCGLASCVVEAATGAIGGSSSHEVMVLAQTGEAEIARCEACGYSANVELATRRATPVSTADTTDIPAIARLHTPGLRSVAEQAVQMDITPADMLKTIVYQRDNGVVVVLIAGDRDIHEDKLQAATGAEFLALADAALVQQLTAATVGFAGPVGLPAQLDGIGAVTVLADHSVRQRASWVTGANATDYHIQHVVPGRDFPCASTVDLQRVVAGDGCPRCATGTLRMMRGIEVGHIFQLGTKYSEPLNAKVLNVEGKEQAIIMGTYGLGIGRTMAAAIEQNHDEQGIVWPVQIAPFHISLLALNMKDAALVEYAERVYADLTAAGFTVLYDDRDERAGVKFADADLLGIPFHVVVGSKIVAQQQIELKVRRTGEKTVLPLAEGIAFLQSALAAAEAA